MADIDTFPLAADGSDGSDGAFDGSDAGAAGPSTGGVVLSRGALIAIIVVVVMVAILGIATSVLFFIAKKREWTVRETIRRSARKVVTVMTPGRTEFPKSVKEGHSRLADVPPTPKITPEHLDLEKGLEQPKRKRANFSRK
ncbi:hypothetical protein MYCTH_2063330 [Thermothelomyces thermophilus ATCC 42464]|uniref:Uncharacterized protein n=1 Tax=Thermothelomyces thermophilus (strain ATCC 42464 / BCRC 31852 / DSM 1799) TaxID=573729 RepID=G2QHF1_THET4|nr:uncharacterized protein MYCTH_2063330 [Thermothelomyces thermophilus ATCC 42464]AEO58811.1 hypothetical protein MYCTH_2063330 [Thermothelomyces thermophilus ATCC 42464]